MVLAYYHLLLGFLQRESIQTENLIIENRTLTANDGRVIN